MNLPHELSPWLISRLRQLLGDVGRLTDRAVTFGDLIRLGLVTEEQVRNVLRNQRRPGAS